MRKFYYNMRLFGVLLGLLAATCFLNAQITFHNLPEAWSYAAAHNMQIKEAEAAKTKAKMGLKESYGSLFPAISANGSFTDNVKIQPTLIPADLFDPGVPAGTYTEATFGRRYIYNASLIAQVDILDMQDWFTIKLARLGQEIASLNITKAKMNIYEQLANIYYTYLLMSEAETLSIENTRVANILYTIANDKYKEGLISEVTLNAALINKEKAEKNLEAAMHAKVLQLNNLKTILNISDSIILEEALTGEFAVKYADSLSPDPDIDIAAVEKKVAENTWASAKASLLPTLTAVYQYNTQVAGDEFLGFKNSNSLGQQYWGLRLSIPIFSGALRKYEMQKAKIDYGIKSREYDHAKLMSQINDQNLLIEYNSSFQAYKRSKNILSLYQKNDMHAERKFFEGLISLDERLKSYDDVITSQNEYLQSLSELFIQHYRLQIRQISFNE